MNACREKIKSVDPRTAMLPSRPRPNGGWSMVAFLVALPLTPTSAYAAPALDWVDVPTDTAARSPSAPSMTTNVLMMMRESSQRLLDAPDVRILRYTARFPVSHQLAEKIHEVATSEGLDPELAFRLVRVESRFHVRARSSQGALGLTQLMPSTARRMDRSLGTDEQILDPRTNLRLGFRYLRTMIERYDDVRLGLLAYNRGPGTVDRVLRSGRDPENGYSRKVLGTSPGTRYEGTGLVEKPH
jgi:soluble lytic murein transglycosylase-like protein